MFRLILILALVITLVYTLSNVADPVDDSGSSAWINNIVQPPYTNDSDVFNLLLFTAWPLHGNFI